MVKREKITPAAMHALYETVLVETAANLSDHRWIVRIPPDLDLDTFVSVDPAIPEFLSLPIEVNELLPVGMVILAPPSRVHAVSRGLNKPPRHMRWVEHHLAGLLIAEETELYG